MTSPLDCPSEGRFDGAEHRFPLRVYFEDTDLSGVVYHANYLRYMERARSDMLRLAGCDQRAAFDAGEGAYAIRDLHIRYASPARLNDVLVVASRMIQLRAASVVIHQRVMQGSVLVAQAEVEAAFVAPSGTPRRHPPAWRRTFETLIWKES